MEEEVVREEEERRRAALQLKLLLRRIMTKEAYDRLSNIKLANPELYAQVVNVILSLYQSGRVSTVDEALLKRIVERLRGPKRETKIRIKRKGV